MPKVLHCIDTTGPGGAETVFVSLAAEFNTSPYESVALIRGPGWVRRELDRRGVTTFEVDSRGSLNVSFLVTLIRYVQRLDIDLIHAHLLGANTYCALAGSATRVPVVSTFHGSVDINPNERFAALKFLLVRKLTTVVAVSEPLRSNISERLGVDPARIRLIPNGIDCHRFEGAVALGLPATLNISDDAFVIGSLGNIREAKAYDVGLQALRRLLDLGVDAHWIIAGQSRPEDRQLQGLQTLSRTLDIAGRVHFAGFVEEPARFLADIDCMLLCSSSEGHPLALTQAMAAATPIVATRCGVENILQQERCAWLAPVGDADALAQAMADVASRPAEARSRGRQAHAVAVRDYDNRAVFDSYRGLYGALLRPDRQSEIAAKRI